MSRAVLSLCFRARSAALLSFCWVALLARGGVPQHDEITDEGFRWSKNDWSLTCDNLRTCRVVYGKDESLGDANGPNINLTLMFTQPAGPAAMLPVEVKGAGTEGELEGFSIEREWLDVESHPAPVEPRALLAAAAEARTLFVQVSLADGSHETVQVALAGLKAVLIKLDDAQHRAGTPLALIARGHASAARVLLPRAMPHVKAMPFPHLALEKSGIPPDAATRLLAQAVQLLPTLKSDDDCQKSTPPILEISVQRWLLGQACTSGSGYNSTTFWWLGEARSPANAPGSGSRASLDGVQWIALPITGEFDFGTGDVSSSLKGRGIGDCSSSERWTYTQAGKWQLTRRAESGPCMGIPGGPWDLPTVVVDVQALKH